jgi:hypothetical protein
VINPKALLADLKAEVKRLQDDLRPTALADEDLRQEWQRARTLGRTAAAFENPWLEDRITQAAVAWVLATIFVRFAEDNGLIEYPYITGPTDPDNPAGDRAAEARELQEQYFQRPEYRGETDREWLRAAFRAMSVSPAARALFEEHNPMWSILPTHDAARDLIAFWRKADAAGHLVHDFTDPKWDTRFLGNLYQDLSEDAKKTYALLQTPEFVEEFILKYTLKPAIEEFGLEPEPPYGHADLPPGLRVIDPACGSGHFLLGAFQQILAAWEAETPMTDKWTLINRSLQSVHGVDKNPYAAAIARFRLMLAAMRAGNVRRLAEDVDFPINVAVGDSLIHGDFTLEEQGELPLEGSRAPYTYRTEDIGAYIRSVRMLSRGSYHAVFANPPYISVKDKAEGDLYRERYKSCYREYSLSVPFAERIFKLAIVGSVEGRGAGYTGQITANSFMKREFGKKLIEEYFPLIDLTCIVDTSGAYIPDHGTPTIILFGRRRFARSNSTIRAVLSVRGEPGEPEDASKGFVWQAIVAQINEPGSESQWISVTDFERKRIAKHPWSLGGGGASELLDLLNKQPRTLKGVTEDIGYVGQTNADDAFFASEEEFARRKVEPSLIRHVAIGELVRDFVIDDMGSAIFPYVAEKPSLDSNSNAFKWLWPSRTVLGNRATFSRLTYFAEGRPWFEWHQVAHARLRDARSLTYAFVVTHNHFVFDRSGQVGNRSAPVVKLPETASADNYLSFLSLLNSSTACFWLKQVSQAKAGSGIGRGVQDEPWEDRYEFTGTKLEQFPLPSTRPLELGRELDVLAQQLGSATSKDEHDSTHARMIALQEELDWDVYHRYSLISDAEFAQLVAPPDSVPELKLGERAFEIVMARQMAAGELDTQWFARHHSTPVAEIPACWPDAYKQVVAARIEFIKSDRNIGLIERPECKRRWQIETWEKKEEGRLKTWLLGRCEVRDLWFDEVGQPRPLTVSNLADRLRQDPDAVAVARQFAGADADMFKVIGDLVDPEHVPYLASLRYKTEALVKRAVWEQTWNLQREEDRLNKRLDIPVPPKYTSADFLRPSFWRHRGKLDVPKERFISYPGASPESDDSLLLGWAGWDHREQAHVLVTLIENRTNTDGWAKDHLTPLIAGLAEVMPWVRQWHADPTDTGESWAEAYDTYLTDQRERHGLTDEDLASWKPAQRAGRRPGPVTS